MSDAIASYPALRAYAHEPTAGEEGYVLFDALMGLAIAALVMAMVTMSLRSTSALNLRAEQEARWRRDILSTAGGIARWLEDLPSPDPNSAPGDPRQYPPVNQPAHGRLMVGTDKDNPLTFDPQKAGQEPVSLVQAAQVKLEHIPSFRLLTPDLLVVSISVAGGGLRRSLVFQHPRRFPAERIAAPYGRKARPGGVP